MPDLSSKINPGSTGRVIPGLTARRAVRAVLLFGILSDISIIATQNVFTDYSIEGRQFLAQTLGSNAGLRILFGEPRNLDTVSGFVEWRILGIMALIGAIWGLFVGTRLLRGEEDSGRWEILLAGPTTRPRAAAAALSGLILSLLALFFITAVPIHIVNLMEAEGFPLAGTFYMAFTVTASVALGMSVAATCGQLAPTRRAAMTWSTGAIGVMYLLRAIGDTVISLHWLRFLTPLGWIEELRPLTGGRPLLLLPLTGLILALALLTVYLAGKRDLGASLLPDRDTAAPRTRLLGGTFGLAFRLNRMALAGWAIGLATLSLVYGLVAKTAAEAIIGQASPLQEVLSNLGIESKAVENYFGLIFFLLTTLLSLFAAGAATGTREEEAQGFLDTLLARPVSRMIWLLQRLTISTLSLLALGIMAGVIAWFGGYTQDSGIALASLLAAGINTAPAAIFILGVGTLCHALVPRYVSFVSYGLIVWSFLVELVGSAINANRYLLNLSLFHHVALVPAAAFDFRSAAVITGAGLAAAALGVWFFSRRDLAGSY